MHYHSHTPFAWHARDGKPRYVRFRLIRGDRGPELDAPDPAYVDQCEKDEAQASILAQQKCLPKDESKSINYLRNEWKERLKHGPITYILQLQLHEVSPTDPPEIRNALLPWDQATHPYMDLAIVTITAPLSYAEDQFMAFEITNIPRSMGILPAKSIDDFNSLNYMRKQSKWAIRTRRFFQRLFGPPKDVPDGGPHGQSPKGM
jgi:arachidonate 5-lipoxygenase